MSLLHLLRVEFKLIGFDPTANNMIGRKFVYINLLLSQSNFKEIITSVVTELIVRCKRLKWGR